MNPREALQRNAERARRMHELYPFTETVSAAALAAKARYNAQRLPQETTKGRLL